MYLQVTTLFVHGTVNCRGGFSYYQLQMRHTVVLPPGEHRICWIAASKSSVDIGLFLIIAAGRQQVQGHPIYIDLPIPALPVSQTLQYYLSAAWHSDAVAGSNKQLFHL
jgi:hypothetical protein